MCAQNILYHRQNVFILWSKLWKRLFLHLNVIYFISDYAIHVEHLFQCLIVLILSSFISCDDFQASLSTRPAITLIPVVFFRHKNHKNKITCTHTHTDTKHWQPRSLQKLYSSQSVTGILDDSLVHSVLPSPSLTIWDRFVRLFTRSHYAHV